MPSRIVIGVEADLQGSGIRGGGGFSSVLPGAAPGSIVVTSGNSHRTLEHFGTARARLGYAVTPTVMGYLTGGLVLLTSLISADKRCLHDILAGVIVVRRAS